MNLYFKNSINIGIIDLSTNNITTKNYSFGDQIFKKYLGMEGIAIEYILKNMKCLN